MALFVWSLAISWMALGGTLLPLFLLVLPLSNGDFTFVDAVVDDVVGANVDDDFDSALEDWGGGMCSTGDGMVIFLAISI